MRIFARTFARSRVRAFFRRRVLACVFVIVNVHSSYSLKGAWAVGQRTLGDDTIDSPDFRELHVDDTCVPVDPDGLADRLVRAGLTDIEVEKSEPPPTRRFRFAARA